MKREVELDWKTWNQSGSHYCAFVPMFKTFPSLSFLYTKGLLFPESFIPLLSRGRESIYSMSLFNQWRESAVSVCLPSLSHSPLCFLPPFPFPLIFLFIRCIDLDKRLALKIFSFLEQPEKARVEANQQNNTEVTFWKAKILESQILANTED